MGIGFLKVLGQLGQYPKFEKDDGFDLGRVFRTIMKNSMRTKK